MEEYVEKLSEEDKAKLLGLLSGARPKVPENNGLSGDEQGSDQSSLDEMGAAGGGTANRNNGNQGQQGVYKMKMPKLSTFSGSKTSKNEPPFTVWKFEVENLRQNFREADVKSAIFQSVSGDAAKTLVRLGQGASVQRILDKFQKVFGSVISDEKKLTDFFNSEQKPNETVAEWACRLEELMYECNLAGLPDRDTLLKARFFSGLFSDDISQAVQHEYKTVEFDQLLVLTREAEDRIATKKNKAIAKAQVVSHKDQQLEEIRKSLKTLTTKAEDWERRLTRIEQNSRTNQQGKQKGNKSTSANNSNKEFVCYFCKQTGHIKRNCAEYLNAKQSAAKGDK